MADQITTQLPLAQQLNDMVNNFTLLDILSKEEQEDILSSKIDLIRKKNEERLKRHQEIEEDRLQASGGVVNTKPVNPETADIKPSSPQTSRSQWKTSPVEQRREQNTSSPQYGLPRTPPNGGSQSPRDGTRSPHGMQEENKYELIQLNNEGRGLGFGLVGQKGGGVVVKTIVPGGAAATDGSLQPGDMMVYVNKTNVKNLTRDQIVDLLKEEQKNSPRVTLQVARGIQQISNARHWSPPNSSHGTRQVGNVYGENADRKMEFTVINDLCTKDEGFPRRRVSEGVCGKTLNVEVDFKGQQRRPTDQRVPGNPVQASPREVWSEKRKQNIDLVEAEIQAMREEYENQKQQDAVESPRYGRGHWLDDPSRTNPNQHDRVYYQQHRSRRSQHSYGGSDFEDATSLMARQKRHQAPRNIDICMTGKERKRYENWKKERDEIDEQRLARHKNATGEWKREWDKEKPGKSQNERDEIDEQRLARHKNATEEWEREWDKEKPGKSQNEPPVKPASVKTPSLSDRAVLSGNDSEDIPPSWGRGRGRGRGVPKKDQQINNDLKFSKIASANIKKMDESKHEISETTDNLNITLPSVDSMPLKFSKIASAHKKKMDESKRQMSEKTDNLNKTPPSVDSMHSAGDGYTREAVLSAGSDHKERRPKSNLHVDLPAPEESALISPGIFKTPPGFIKVTNWAEEMERLSPVNNL